VQCGVVLYTVMWCDMMYCCVVWCGGEGTVRTVRALVHVNTMIIFGNLPY
jgi:hypothetical protein